MNINEKMRLNASYVCYDYDINPKFQIKAKDLIYDYNNTRPDEKDRRKYILRELMGAYNDNVIIEPSFRCFMVLIFILKVLLLLIITVLCLIHHQ